MPLAGTGDVLGTLMRQAIDGVHDKTDRTELFHALGRAIVAHIVANGTILGSATGVTPGVAVVPVAGTIL